SFYPISTDIMRATFRTIHVLAPYIHTLLCNAKITYDPEVDILRIILSDVPIEDSDEEKPGVILDYDEDGNIIAL
ncbi:DUF2283 domain-containing protein, partial [Nostoc sp.]|uniref:DUF2283 domain-containing protein n=1 Tax=Nostoc sp. TaxID=1180 RepID=UPI002FFA985F